MYFSVLTLLPSGMAQGAAAAIGSPYAEHQWLWTLFDRPQGAPRPFLYRVIQQAGALPRVYLLSSVVPRLPQGSAWTVQTRPYDPQAAAGQLLSFELRANPVITRPSDRNGKRRSRREDVVMDAKTLLMRAHGASSWKDLRSPDKPSLYTLVGQVGGDWLRKQAAEHGFVLDGIEEDVGLTVDNYQRQVLAKGGGRAANNDGIVLSTVDFRGQLRVTNSANFRRALLDGVGHGKAFGCGLLLVRRA